MPAPRYFTGTSIITFSFTLLFPLVDTWVRIPMGNFGNLKEDIGALVLFAIITFALMFLINIWMIIPDLNGPRWAPDLGLNTVSLALLFLQFVMAFSTVSSNKE